MAALPAWLIGKNTATTITPCTIGTAGAITLGTAASLAGQLDEVNIQYEADVEEINAMDSVLQNKVIVTKGTTLVLTEILKYAGTNILAGKTAIGDYFYIQCTRGAQVWSDYCVCTGYEERMPRGKSVATAKFSPVDPGTANPTYA